MTIKVALIGLGKMGRVSAKRILESGDSQVVAAFDLENVGADVGALAGVGGIGVKVTHPSELANVLKSVKPDVAIDFTSAKACIENAKTVAAAGVNMVIGSTGFTDEEVGQLKDTLKSVGVVFSPNMSVGVNVFWKIIGEAARNLKGYDIEVIEAHHRFKKDAPSGTAMKAVKVLAEAVGADLKKDVVYARHGDCKRRDGEIGVQSIRAGDIVGEHTVMFSTIGERFEVRHVAHSRDSFSSGIPSAVRFIKGRKGFYDMADVLGLR
ncbi:MAG: 4-hydroxy-tetrahydrodipicolinate reductase [Candidatus Altiarchaeota archaeon]